MKEYGGYLEFEYFEGEEYHSKGLALNSGRSCLRYILRARKINKIAIPFYICSGVIEACQKEDVEVCFYSVDKNFHPCLSSKVYVDAIYVVNYYGQLNNNYLMHLRDKYRRIIIDNSQAFFQLPIKGVDTIYTCRKFFGVPDGAYLYTDAIAEEVIQKQYGYNRLKFLAGRYEKTASQFYKDFQKNECFLGRQNIKNMSDMARNILRAVNYERVCSIREANYQVLERNLSGLNELEVQMGAGPYMYPLMLENGKVIRKKLQEHGVYVPCLWPNVINSDVFEQECYYAENILPIPCDQRYVEGDIVIIIDIINSVLEESL